MHKLRRRKNNLTGLLSVASHAHTFASSLPSTLGKGTLMARWQPSAGGRSTRPSPGTKALCFCHLSPVWIGRNLAVSARGTVALSAPISRRTPTMRLCHRLQPFLPEDGSRKTCRRRGGGEPGDSRCTCARSGTSNWGQRANTGGKNRLPVNRMRLGTFETSGRRLTPAC